MVNSAKKAGNKTNFVSKEDHEIIKVWNIKSYEVKVRQHGSNLQLKDLVLVPDADPLYYDQFMAKSIFCPINDQIMPKTKLSPVSDQLKF